MGPLDVSWPCRYLKQPWLPRQAGRMVASKNLRQETGKVRSGGFHDCDVAADDDDDVHDENECKENG